MIKKPVIRNLQLKEFCLTHGDKITVAFLISNSNKIRGLNVNYYSLWFSSMCLN